MEKLTWPQAYNLIIDDYFKDEIKPMSCHFCFCGILSGKNGTWLDMDWQGLDFHNGYSPFDYYKMEKALLTPLIPYGANFSGYYPNIPGCWSGSMETDMQGYEDTLFEGMCAALEVLKEIHKDRGENVDEEIPFKKRELKTV